MKCSNHPEADAIETCMVCDKPLCKECVADVNGCIACNSTCRRKARRKIKQDRSEKLWAEIWFVFPLLTAITFLILLSGPNGNIRTGHITIGNGVMCSFFGIAARLKVDLNRRRMFSGFIGMLIGVYWLIVHMTFPGVAYILVGIAGTVYGVVKGNEQKA